MSRASRSTLIDISAELVLETADAGLYNFEMAEKVWLPKSQHEYDADEELVTLEERLAIQKGLI